MGQKLCVFEKLSSHSQGSTSCQESPPIRTMPEPPPLNAEHQEPPNEEGNHSYVPGGFHPVYIGDVFNNRYEVLSKLGWGGYSTVWLVKDRYAPGNALNQKYRALKILKASAYGHGTSIYEKEVLTCLRHNRKRYAGSEHICHLLDDFMHAGPNGHHACLVFELMGECLGSFRARYHPRYRIPEQLLKRFTIQMVKALGFAHHVGIVHCDVKNNNIFMRVQDYSRIESGYLAEVSKLPRQDRSEAGYTVIPSFPVRDFYFNPDSNNLNFDIAVGDWGLACWSNLHFNEIIQPELLRAPEVILGARWDQSADWWTLGMTVYELLIGQYPLYRTLYDSEGFSVRKYLAEIEHILGPFPKKLLDCGKPDKVKQFFNGHGRVRNAPFIERPKQIEVDFLNDLEPLSAYGFSSWFKLIMRLDPSQRPSAAEILSHDWLRMCSEH